MIKYYYDRQRFDAGKPKTIALRPLRVAVAYKNGYIIIGMGRRNKPSYAG